VTNSATERSEITGSTANGSTPVDDAGPPGPSSSVADNDLREAIRAMLTLLGCGVLMGEGGRARAELAASVGHLLNINLPETADRRPNALAAAVPIDANTVRMLIRLLQRPEAGAARRLALAVDPVTLKMRPGYRVPLKQDPGLS
jgi:hypothetical protein